MSNELIISRTMAMCFPPDRDASVPEGSVYQNFRTQMDEAWRALLGLKTFEVIDRVATGTEHGYVVKPYEPQIADELEETGIQIFRIPKDSSLLPKPINRAPADHHVGLFESRMYKLTKDGLTWILRARPSVTGCALERPLGMAKLWWTFEGIPTDIIQRAVTHDDAKSFVAVTNAIAQEVMPNLNRAYGLGLKGVDSDNDADFGMRDDRVSIRLADNDGRPFAALVDAMGLDRITFEDAAKGEVVGKPYVSVSEYAQAGAREVEAFVKEIARAPEGSIGSMALNKDIRGVQGVVCGLGDAVESNGKEALVAGVARASGMSGLRGVMARNEDTDERVDYVRTISAARPLSAMLANKKAMELENAAARG